MIRTKNKNMNKKLLNETATSQATLSPKSIAHDDLSTLDGDFLQAIHQSIGNLAKDHDAEEVTNFLQAALDAAFRKDHGVPDGTAQKNRKDYHYHRESFLPVAEKLAQDDLSEQLVGIGFSKEQQDAVKDMFLNAVEARFQANDGSFRHQVGEFLAEYGAIDPFILTGERIDVVEELGEMIEELEYTLAMVEKENARIAEELCEEELEQELEQELEEEVSRSRSPKRCTIEEQMLTGYEENKTALWNEDCDDHSGDPEVRRYLSYYKREEN